MEQNDTKKSSDLANRYYEPEDYQKKDEVSSGLATTHEQVSDAYMEGEINAVVDDVKGQDIPIKHEGYNK